MVFRMPSWDDIKRLKESAETDWRQPMNDAPEPGSREQAEQRPFFGCKRCQRNYDTIKALKAQRDEWKAKAEGWEPDRIKRLLTAEIQRDEYAKKFVDMKVACECTEIQRDEAVALLEEAKHGGYSSDEMFGNIRRFLAKIKGKT